MVSFPVPSSVPSLDTATKDIRSILEAMPDVNCGFGSKTAYIVVTAKASNSPILLPVSGATIEGRISSFGVTVKTIKTFADLNGIASACITDIGKYLGFSYDFSVKQYDVDFGNGYGQFSNWKKGDNIVVFNGTSKSAAPAPVPCTGSIGLQSGFNINNIFSGLTSIPTSLQIPLQVTSNKTFLPMKISVDGKEAAYSATGFTSFDLVSIYSGYGRINASFGNSHTITIESTDPSCNIPKLTIPILAFLPLSQCTGSIIANAPNFKSLLSGVSIPSSIGIPVSVTNNKSYPMKISVDGDEIDRSSSGYSSIDIIRLFKKAAPPIDMMSEHTLKIESTAIDCNILPKEITIPPLVPTGTLPTTPLPTCTPPQIYNPITKNCETPVISIPSETTPSGICTTLITVADTPSFPNGLNLPDIKSTLYLYIGGIKEVCKEDPTNPSFIKKLPAGTMGTICLGNKSVNFQLTADGIADLDLSKLIDIASINPTAAAAQCAASLPQVYKAPTAEVVAPVSVYVPRAGRTMYILGYSSTGGTYYAFEFGLGGKQSTWDSETNTANSQNKDYLANRLHTQNKLHASWNKFF